MLLFTGPVSVYVEHLLSVYNSLQTKIWHLTRKEPIVFGEFKIHNLLEYLLFALLLQSVSAASIVRWHKPYETTSEKISKL